MNKWLPIETAPMDGSEVLCGETGSGDMEFYRFIDGEWRSRGDYFPPNNQLTHWFPLTPPEIEK